MPPLTRTLGPVIQPTARNQAEIVRQRASILRDLLELLPPCSYFSQTLDPRIGEALVYSRAGYSVSLVYTLVIPPTADVDAVWAGTRTKTRNLIRRAGESHDVVTLDAPTFVREYVRHVSSKKRTMIYDQALLLQVCDEALRRQRADLMGARNRATGEIVAATGVFHDEHAHYYLLSMRADESHSGAVSLLIWKAISRAMTEGRSFDFDGVSSARSFAFLSGFPSEVVPRLVVTKATIPGRMSKAAFDLVRGRSKGLNLIDV